MTWLWLLICWGCLLAGFFLGAWWAATMREAEKAQQDIYMAHLEEEIVQLKRKVEWERKRADADAP